jgi:glycosyltransferase involved in cell wall biosynthesis
LSPTSLSRPRIAVDARMIGMGGIGRYTGSLLKEMMRQRPQLRWTLIGRPEALAGFAADGAEVRECRARIYSPAEAFGMARLLNDADLVHVPHFNAPFLVRPRLIVTVHDLIHFDYPEYQPFPGANAVLDWKLARLLRRADAVVAVSRATADAVAKRYPKTGAAAKTRVTWEASADVFSPEPRPDDGEMLPRKGIEGPYFLYVGAIREHKEVHTLLAAFEALKKAHPEVRADLVLSGRLDARFEKKHGFTERLARRSDIRWVQDADDRELAALYRRALALVMPSRLEGFGLPVLEAMRSGTPVILSDTPSLTEVAGDAALVFPTGQIDPLADRLYNVLSDPSFRETLSNAGFRRASEFSWSKTAALTLEIYDSLL